jgi:hypothetical protein
MTLLASTFCLVCECTSRACIPAVYCAAYPNLPPVALDPACQGCGILLQDCTTPSLWVSYTLEARGRTLVEVELCPCCALTDRAEDLHLLTGGF